MFDGTVFDGTVFDDTVFDDTVFDDTVSDGTVSRGTVPRTVLDGTMTDPSASAPATKPDVDFPTGPAPDTLQIRDLTVGHGEHARPGDRVRVHYVGVEFDTGAEFDSSWNRGEAIEFPLTGLIKGWQDGIPGMQVGGRRELVIPPEQAYGAASSGHRLGGKTLIFVIDLLAVR